MRTSLRVAKIIGIPINIHITFLIIIPLFAWAFGVADVVLFGIPLGFGGLEIGLASKLALGTVAAIIFFGSVLLHELAHSYVALRNGYTISGITLFIFGGVAQIEKVPPEAPGEGLMAFVGPATSFAVGLVMLPISYLFEWLGTGLVLEALSIMFGLIGFYNLLLGGFNLLPAFPMDGGRVLRSVLAKRMGFIRATETAVSVGKAVAVAMAIVGLFINIWLILIALFIYIGAGEEEKGTKISHALRGVKVRDLMTTEVSTVSGEMTLKELLEKILRERHLGYPVVEGGRLQGVVTLHDMIKVPPDQQEWLRVRDVMSRNVMIVSPDTDALEAVQIILKNNLGRLVVMEDDRLVGILSRTDIMRALEIYPALAMQASRSISY